MTLIVEFPTAGLKITSDLALNGLSVQSKWLCYKIGTMILR